MASGQKFDNAPKNPTTEHTVYVLNGVVHLPHYYKTGVFVSPGYGRQNMSEYSDTELIRAGAKQDVRHLWVR